MKHRKHGTVFVGQWRGWKVMKMYHDIPRDVCYLKSQWQNIQLTHDLENELGICPGVFQHDH